MLFVFLSISFKEAYKGGWVEKRKIFASKNKGEK